MELEPSRSLPKPEVTASRPRPDALLAAVVAESSDAIICIDSARRIVEFNRGAERMFLRTRQETSGQLLEILMPDRFRAAHDTYLDGYAANSESRRMATDRPVVRGIRSNGEEFVADATIAKHQLDGQLWFSVIMRDLGARARDEVAHERRWRELFEAASDGIFIADLDGRYTDVNTAGCQLLGYRRDELIGKTIIDLIPGEHVERLAETRRRLAAGGIQVAEWMLRHKDGVLVPVEVSAKIMADGRWVAFVRDIRDRKAVQAALDFAEQRLRVALTGSPVSAYSQDRELRYTWTFNPPAPLSPADIIGRTQEELAPSELARHLTEIKRRVIETGRPARETISNVIAGTERFFDTIIEPLRDAEGAIVGITGAGWDVTDRKRAEDEDRFFAEVSTALSAATLDWTQLLTTVAPLALGVIADFCIAELVDDAGDVLRLDVVHSDAAKRGLCDALRAIPLDRSRPHLGSEAIRTRRPEIVEVVSEDYLRSNAQSDHHLELLRGIGLRSLIAVPLVNRERLLGAYVLGSVTRHFGADDLRVANELASRVAIAIDNARLHRAAQRAARARAEVLAIVAHDLRNPLNAIMLQSELIASERAENPTVDRVLDRIGRSAERMMRLSQDLLDVVRLEAGEPLAIELATVAPADIAEESLDSLQPLADVALIDLVLDCAADLPEVRADRHRIAQVLDNLVGNAIKFSARRARIVVAIRRHDEDVLFSVADTGPGIQPDQVEHLFDRFWQADRNDRRGTGLGLSVVKGIVEAHEGNIWVDTQIGRGTTFYFTIPTA